MRKSENEFLEAIYNKDESYNNVKSKKPDIHTLKNAHYMIPLL